MADFLPLVSAALGYAIVAGSFSLKLPQIVRIVKAGSAQGVSLPAHIIECTGYVIGASWGLARGLSFKDFGESLIILVQLVALVLLIGYFTRRIVPATAALVVLGGAFLALAGDDYRSVHEVLFRLSPVFTITSRVPQVYSNYRHRSTGQLSFLTCFLALGGAGARVLTSAVSVPWEKGKASMVVQFLIAGTLSFILVAQIILYKPKAAKEAREADGKKTAPRVASPAKAAGKSH